MTGAPGRLARASMRAPARPKGRDPEDAKGTIACGGTG